MDKGNLKRKELSQGVFGTFGRSTRRALMLPAMVSLALAGGELGSEVESFDFAPVAGVVTSAQFVTTITFASLAAIALAPNVLAPRRRKCGFRWEDLLAKYWDKEFHASFRFSKVQFNGLLDIFGHELVTNDQMQAVRSSGRWISPEQRLACYLRWAAGGDVKDVKMIFDMSVTEVWRCVWKCTDLVNNHFKDKCKFPMPYAGEELTDRKSYDDKLVRLSGIEAGFRAAAPNQARNAWVGQVGALDGALIATPNPGKQVENPAEFYCSRKGTYGMLLMACCDALRRFVWWDMSHCPISHDSAAFKSTSLSADLAAGLLPHPFFVSGDSAFQPGHNSLIVPGGSDAFNWVQDRKSVV